MSRSNGRYRKPSLFFCILAVVGSIGFFVAVGAQVGVVLVTGFPILSDWISRKPLLLVNEISLVSPDGKTRFVAQRTGELTLVDVQTGRTLFNSNAKPYRYTTIEAKWSDNEHVSITGEFRYPLLMDGDSRVWDARSGVMTGTH